MEVLHSICQQIWTTQQWPQDWKRSVFIPISKKGNAKECSNYRTIALISHTSKIMLKILQAWLQYDRRNSSDRVLSTPRQSWETWGEKEFPAEGSEGQGPLWSSFGADLGRCRGTWGRRGAPVLAVPESSWPHSERSWGRDFWKLAWTSVAPFYEMSIKLEKLSRTISKHCKLTESTQ